MQKIKDIVLSGLLAENENFLEISPDVIGDIKDVTFSKGDNYLKIEFTTTYGKDLDLLVKYTDFKQWMTQNANKYKNMFSDFITDFISKSKEVEKLDEIVDDDGNIMPSTDKPSNATNTMVGSSVWDLEKVYRTTMPKSIRFWSGDLGMGAIVW